MPNPIINALPSLNAVPTADAKASADPAAANVSAIAQEKIIRDTDRLFPNLRVFIPETSDDEIRMVAVKDEDPPPYSPTGAELSINSGDPLPYADSADIDPPKY